MRFRPRHTGALRQCLCFLLFGQVLFFGCASRNTRKTSSINRAKNIKISAAELSSRNQSLLAVYSAEIESAADKVILESPSLPARREALIWKAEAIPVLQTSLLNTDPLAAVIDTWAFIYQMSAYMNQAEVKSRLGIFHATTDNTLMQMDAEMEQLVVAAAPSAKVKDVRQVVASWAADHPIRTGLSGRTSADASVIHKTYRDDLGSLASLKALQEGLGDITARLDSYNAYLPKQSRWQAELLISDLSNDPEFKGVAANLSVLTRALEKTANNLDRMPDFAAAARRIALSDLGDQRKVLESFLSNERVHIFDALTQQRVAAMADLRAERLAATTDLRGERQIVLDSIHAQEVAAMQDLDALRQQAVNDVDQRSRRLVDHFFWRAVEIVAGALLLSFLMVWVLLRRFTSRDVVHRGHYERAA